MKFSRSSRLIAACVMLFSMFFTQLAVAAYVCPGSASPYAQTGLGNVPMGHNLVDTLFAAEIAATDMAHCAGQDKVQPNLCQAHDHADNQSLDKPANPAVSPFTPATLVLELGTIESPKLLNQPAPQSQELALTSAPPLSIQHCCFRI